MWISNPNENLKLNNQQCIPRQRLDDEETKEYATRTSARDRLHQFQLDVREACCDMQKVCIIYLICSHINKWYINMHRQLITCVTYYNVVVQQQYTTLQNDSRILRMSPVCWHLSCANTVVNAAHQTAIFTHSAICKKDVSTAEQSNTQFNLQFTPS